MKRFSITFVAIYSILGAFTVLIFDSLTLADERAKAVRICVNGILYTNIYSDGQPAGNRNDVDDDAAGVACKGVTTIDEAKAVRICVNGILYTNIYADGQPAGGRTDVSSMAAAKSCALQETSKE